MTIHRIILKPGKEQSAKRLHPWIFSGAISRTEGKPVEGDLVEVISADGEYLGIGHYQPGSITVRILTFQKEEIDHSFWVKRISAAWELRRQMGFPGEQVNVFRIVNGEGDFLPGLIIDYYNGTAVMQAHSAGMYYAREEIAGALKSVGGSLIQGIYNKSESTLPFKAGIVSKSGYLYGGTLTGDVIEYGNKFRIDWEEGQKTGFFIDQRENRKLLAEYSKGRSVLNMFCYTGGFSVYACRGGAELVHSVDTSKKAVELTDLNISLNFPGYKAHKSFAADAFDFLKNTDPIYDMIVLDPPAFAKHHSALNNALQGYRKLNRRAIEIIKPGGILFTFSCSQAVSRENFRKSVFTAAANTGRSVRILYQPGQPADHPVSIYHPEGEYLKGLVLQVE